MTGAAVVAAPDYRGTIAGLRRIAERKQGDRCQQHRIEHERRRPPPGLAVRRQVQIDNEGIADEGDGVMGSQGDEESFFPPPCHHERSE